MTENEPTGGKQPQRLCDFDLCPGHYAPCTHVSSGLYFACDDCVKQRGEDGPTICETTHNGASLTPIVMQTAPHNAPQTDESC